MSSSTLTANSADNERPGRLRRLAVYFTTMFPIAVNAPTAAVLFLAYYTTLGRVRHEAPTIGWQMLPAVASLVLCMLMMRTFDELKDEGIDAEVFPHRPLVTGAVRYSDVRLLGLLAMLCVVPLNLGRGAVTDSFLVMLTVAVLSWQWWFFPEVVSPSFALTFATHQPLVPLQFLYIHSWYAEVQGVAVKPVEAGALCVSFWLPFILWEIGRKIRAPEQEDKYLSYTKRWGLRRAVLTVLTLVVASVAAGLGVAAWAGWSLTARLALVGAGALVLLIVARFLKTPSARTNIVKPAVEGFLFTFYAIPSLEWLWSRLS